MVVVVAVAVVAVAPDPQPLRYAKSRVTNPAFSIVVHSRVVETAARSRFCKQCSAIKAAEQIETRETLSRRA